jgi:hypothetical protein
MSGLVKAEGIPGSPIVLALGSLTSPVVFTDIANIGDFSGSSSRQVEDVSAHGVGARRKVTTLLDSGEFSATLFFIPGANVEPTHTDATDGLQAIYERNDLRQYALFYRDQPGTAKYFNAFISKFGEKYPVAGILSCDFTLTIDGVVTTGTEAGGPASAVFAPAES